MVHTTARAKSPRNVARTPEELGCSPRLLRGASRRARRSASACMMPPHPRLRTLCQPAQNSPTVLVQGRVLPWTRQASKDAAEAYGLRLFKALTLKASDRGGRVQPEESGRTMLVDCFLAATLEKRRLRDVHEFPTREKVTIAVRGTSIGSDLRRTEPDRPDRCIRTAVNAAPASIAVSVGREQPATSGVAGCSARGSGVSGRRRTRRGRPG